MACLVERAAPEMSMLLLLVCYRPLATRRGPGGTPPQREEAASVASGTPSPRRGKRGYLGNQRARSSSLTSAADAKFEGGDSTTTL